MNNHPTGFKLKTTGKVNVWDITHDKFVLGTPMDDIVIMTRSTTLTNQLIEAMKNRDNVSITIGEEGDPE